MPTCWAIDGVEPLEVVSPSSEDQLSRIVASADSDGTALFPRGGGTRIDLGGVPSRPGIIIDMTGIDQVVAHNYADLTATFQAGITIRQVSETLSHQGQLLAIDPPLPGRATVGGTLAAGVSGPLKWHFGHPRDTVIGMKVVQPDGQVTKSGGQVVKNVSGYDMSRLHVGGLGTLGIILEASFKLTPLPMYEKTIVAAYRNIQEAQSAALAIFNSHVMPLAMTVFDASAARRTGMDSEPSHWRLAVRLGGRSRTLDRQVDDVTSICDKADSYELEPVEGRSAEPFWQSLRDFGWEPDSAPLLGIRASALPSDLCKIVSAVDQTQCPALDPSIVAQPAFGAVDIFWYPSSPSPLTGEGWGEGDRRSSIRAMSDNESILADELRRMISQFQRAVAEIGGSAVVQLCPPEIKRDIDVWGGEPPGIETMRRLKKQYDPNNIMNPGRFVGTM